ncbi:MAG: hypothetical protein ACYDGN_05735 [Acidimicrobiales bacterium]
MTSCGGSGASDASHPATTPRQSATTSTLAGHPSTTTNPTSTAVLAAYRAEWAAFEQALSTANASDPGLAATMVAPMLQEVRRNLVSDQVNGIVGRGGVQDSGPGRRPMCPLGERVLSPRAALPVPATTASWARDDGVLSAVWSM